MGLKASKLKILVVEDTLSMRSIICSVLLGLGIKDFLSASNAHNGFNVFRKNNPDIVITDWVMDKGDGIELTQLIRKSAQSPNRLTPIIMVSGFAAKDRITQARDAGVTEYLAKPFSAKQLAQRITHVINKPRNFIDYSDYFGPDRRRRNIAHYFGPFRRELDDNIMYVGI